MQIAKSLNYKMRCKGFLKTPPTRIKCIIFFRLSIRCVHFFSVVNLTQWEIIQKKMTQNISFQILGRGIFIYFVGWKKCHFFQVFWFTVMMRCSKAVAFFFCMPARIWGVVDRVWNSKACFFYHLRRSEPRIFCCNNNLSLLLSLCTFVGVSL